MRFLGTFPQSVGRSVLPRFVARNALNPSILNDFSRDRLLSERLANYQDLASSFPAVVAGAALGGATTHLSLALGGPFLPQAFVMPIKRGSIRGDVQVYLQRSLWLAKTITKSNPGIICIQHFDPVHNGWFTNRANQLRLKLISLPEIYRQYILHVLEPGGTVSYLDCEAEWLPYRLDTHNYFQVGGWGGIAWEAALSGLAWSNIDARPRHYPADTRTISDWAIPLRKLAQVHPQPVRVRLSGEELLALSSSG